MAATLYSDFPQELEKGNEDRCDDVAQGGSLSSTESCLFEPLCRLRPKGILHADEGSMGEPKIQPQLLATTINKYRTEFPSRLCPKF
ncbi:unnamed protein product [Arctogadus glacialis]